MKKLIITLLTLLVTEPLISASANDVGDNKTIRAYEYNIPEGYTIKSIDTDSLGNVYYSALIDESHAKLVAISPSGQTKWSVNTPAGKDLYVMTDFANHVYASTGSKLISYEPDGSVNWSKDLGTNSFTASPGKDSVVLSTDGRIWAYDERGKILYYVDYSKEGKVALPDFGYGIWTKSDHLRLRLRLMYIKDLKSSLPWTVRMDNLSGLQKSRLTDKPFICAIRLENQVNLVVFTHLIWTAL